MAQLLHEGLELSRGVTLLVGENGSGKSTLVEVGEWGLRETTWEDLDLVWHWRRFLGTPEAYLRHLTAK